jgi:hypothetical protein
MRDICYPGHGSPIVFERPGGDAALTPSGAMR